jgi:prepilin-type N-terminal cleavage/methylation domain-containing protein
MSTRRDPERGLTLTELMVVIVLASVLMTGLVVFYLNAQTIWLDTSAQAITQRELSLAVRTIARHARVAKTATFFGGQLELRPAVANADSNLYFWLNPDDSTLHAGYLDNTDVAQQDLGPVIQSKVTVFGVQANTYMVQIDSLRALTAQNQPITISSSVALMNR